MDVAGDSPDYIEASDVFWERHVYGGEQLPRPDECVGAASNPFIYEHMWGRTEYHSTGNLAEFALSEHTPQINIPALLAAGRDSTMPRDTEACEASIEPAAIIRAFLALGFHSEFPR